MIDQLVNKTHVVNGIAIYLNRQVTALALRKLQLAGKLINIRRENLSRYLASLGEDEYVIATGGGICNNQEALDSLQRLGFFLFLEVPEEVAANRIIEEIEWEDGAMKNLPAYIEKEAPTTTEQVAQIFSGFYKQRTSLYRKLAQITCNLTGVTPEENCQLICEALFSQDCRWD